MEYRSRNSVNLNLIGELIQQPKLDDSNEDMDISFKKAVS